MAALMIAVDLAGRGQPLVLLHGVGANRGIWRRATSALQADRLVLAPDIPGFGDSPPAPGAFSLEHAAAALADGLSEHVGEPFDLVGNSLGGAVALMLARQRPALVRRLVLVAPAGFSPAPRLVAWAGGRLSEPATVLRRVLGAPLSGSALARRALLWGAIADPASLSPQAAREMLQASQGSSRIGAAITAVLSADLRGELAGVEAPVGVIWGERDRIIPVRTLQSILAVCPRAAVETLRDAAHVPQLERPAEFVLALRRVLEALGPG